MSKFNKKLSQMESIYNIAPPVVEQVEPVFVSDFIHHVFENSATYDIEPFSKKWFKNYASRSANGSFKFVDNLLQESGHIVSRKSILEGITEFSKENDDEL